MMVSSFFSDDVFSGCFVWGHSSVGPCEGFEVV